MSLAWLRSSEAAWLQHGCCASALYLRLAGRYRYRAVERLITAAGSRVVEVAPPNWRQSPPGWNRSRRCVDRSAG